MMIVVDPTELAAAAETLRTCSIEAGEIGSQLWSCAQCAMPADLQAVVDQLVGAVDRALDSVGTQLLIQALEVTKRALIALNDSQAATMAVSNATPGQVSAGESLFGGTLTIGGTNPTDIGIAGWSPFDTMTFGETSDKTAGWLDSMTGDAVADDSSINAANMLASWMAPLEPADATNMAAGWLDSMSGDGVAVDTSIDASNMLANWMAPLTHANASGPSAAMILAGFVQRGTAANQAAINAIVAGGNPALFPGAMDAQARLDGMNNHLVAPSPGALEDAAGHSLTDSEIRIFNPDTLTSPGSPISAR